MLLRASLLPLVLLAACSPRRPDPPAVEAADRAGSSCPIPAYVGDAGSAKSVTGAALATCPAPEATGFYRTGYCSTGPEDLGVHVVCARVTTEFLQFSKAQGNDLITKRGSFPGLSAGDAWCLCGARWREALDAGVAPPVVLEATDEAALRFADRDTLSAHRAQ